MFAFSVAKARQFYLYCTFHVIDNSVCFTATKKQQDVEKNNRFRYNLKHKEYKKQNKKVTITSTKKNTFKPDSKDCHSGSLSNTYEQTVPNPRRIELKHSFSIFILGSVFSLS